MPKKDKSKKDNKAKPKAKARAKPKQDKSYTVHKKAADSLKKKMDAAHHRYIRAESDFYQSGQNADTLDKKHAAKWHKRMKEDQKRIKSANSAYKRYKKKYEKEKKYTKHSAKGGTKMSAKEIKSNQKAVSSKIASHAKGGWKNEGNCAIYRTDGHSANVIFISPSDDEERAMEGEATSWPVDEDAPRSNYVRNTGDTSTVSGMITGNDRAEANKKYDQLVYWHHHNTALTYEGDFKQDYLFITGLTNQWHNFRDNLEVAITFTHVRPAKVTTKSSTGNNSKVKKSKSSKTTRGSRNKKYTAITVKPGATLLGYARKYGTSVAWLQKVNKIKNPNKISAGRHLYVGVRQKSAKNNLNKITSGSTGLYPNGQKIRVR